MPNPYITNIDPYGQQDLSGFQPIMQDIAQQKLMQQLALAQQNQQISDAGKTGGSGMAGLSPLALAAMLRKKKDGYGAGDAYSNMTPAEIANMKENGV